MSTEQLRALEALTLNWTRDLKDVWAPYPYHIEGLHPQAARLIRRGIGEASTTTGQNPLGIAIQGEGGVGKTHLLGWTREQVQAGGGYFFLVGDLSRTGFWDEVLGTIVRQLQPLEDGSRRQLETLLTDLAEKAGLDGVVRAAVTGQRLPSAGDIGAFVTALRRLAPSTLASQDTARALVLLASPQFDHQDIGYSFFSGGDVDAEERRYWGIKSRPKKPQLLIQELSGLLALSGPTVLAVDQIDALIDEVNRAPEVGTSQRHAVREVASGLMALRDMTHRTLTVISCLPETWGYVREYAIKTVTGRFGEPVQLKNIPSADVGRLMIEKRFATGFARAGFEPPYPSWPIRSEAFEEARRYTARTLLQRVDAHVSMCIDEHGVRELDRLGGAPEDSLGRVRVVSADIPSSAAKGDLTALDAQFRELRESIDPSSAFAPETEDAKMSTLLAAGLNAWIKEHGEPVERLFATERLSLRNPPLHASLLMVTDQRLERQSKWAFRAIAAENPKTVQARVRKAVTAAGLGAEGTERQLFVLRNTPWPNGPVTEREIAEFSAKGGIALAITGEDLKTFAALARMLADPHPELRGWLIARRPAHRTELLSRALGEAEPSKPEVGRESPIPEAPRAKTRLSDVPLSEGTLEGEPSAASSAGRQGKGQPMAGPAIRIGTAVLGQVPVSLDLELLRRHVSVFAGAGSGKTALLRRVIESCALHGVSSIVLDPNNDLARLGDAWPDPQEHWTHGDAELARNYLTNTDVVIWTPGRDRGRPLSFHPLPKFADILDDKDELRAKDEFREAVDATIEALAPRVNADKGTGKAEAEKAVLREALSYFGHGGGSSLDDFLELLSDLPDDACTIAKASMIATELADRLRIAKVNDPLFAGSGEPVDPGILLSPPPGKRARVSVISLVGLPGLKQRQSFVNQLQMALFSWIKKHPASDRQLGGLFVMDEAQELAPSGRSTLCRESTLRLVAQARKYGLGMLFATQQPKGLHNSIPNNSTTQFYGLLGSPAQIEAGRELARMKGGDIPDVGRLKAGQFYFATEGSGFRKVRTPMCLSYHPSSPLTEEEVIRRARGW
jgi:hypothetical protein